MNEKLYVCESCGKTFTEDWIKWSDDVPRFCSRACSNKRHHSKEVKEKISSSVKKTIESAEYICKHCHRKFKHKETYIVHEQSCTSQKRKHKKSQMAYHTEKAKINGKELDKTWFEIDEYRKEHPVCEICGRSAEEATKTKSKYGPHSLCVDHNHSTNKFRGGLCSLCNRQLGWFEKNKDSIIRYLNKEGS